LVEGKFKKRHQEHGDDEEFQVKRDQTHCIYLLYLVGVTLFNDKSVNCVDVTNPKYIRDLELVPDYACGAAALAHMYSLTAEPILRLHN